MLILGKAFSIMMSWCYLLVKNYGLAIIVFTILTKVVMIPISIMVQVNSIKMVKMYPEMNRIKAKFWGSKDLLSEENYKLYKREKYHPMLDLVPVIVQLVILMGVVEGLKMFEVDNKNFCGLNLGLVPYQAMGITVIIPVLAAISAWFMCFSQNRINVLQAEQSKLNKISTLMLSVGLSLYLGFFVEGGVGLYWTIGNILAVIQLVILNMFINPKKHVDYDDLEASRQELAKVLAQSTSAKKKASKEELAKEKADYKRFFKFGSKQLVFYSEKNGFYKYFKDVIEYIIKRTDIVIHYVTSDINDEVFSMESEQFRVYYIGENKLIVLMMKMDADMVVMTMPDLQKYQIKRSLVKHDIEYVYMDHAVASANLTLRKHALDYFDTIFATNELMKKEIEAMEDRYSLNKKCIVEYGYSLIDNMIENYNKEGRQKHDVPEILIAPSWQEGNIMDSHIEKLLDALLGKGYHVIVRPHPQYVRHYTDKLNALGEKYKSHYDFELQLDFSSNKTVFDADVLITDWSGIAYEYSFTTLKPALFIDTPMKIMNADYQEIDIVPFDIEARNKVGISISPDDIDGVESIVQRLLTEEIYAPDSLREIRERYLYNVGKSANVGAKYIINRLVEMSKK